MKKITKQILAALLVMISFLQISVITYAKEQEDASADIMLLTKLGFVDENYGPKSGDETVTRAQLASMIAYLRGFDESYANVSKKFVDIPMDYWCAGQIYALYDSGIINGTSENMFSPNDYVTYPQVIKCLVSLLGYDVQAQQLGGYPNGYISVASRIGLGSGMASSAVDFNTVAKLMTKAMDTEVLELKMTSSGASYSKAEDETPLKKYNDIYYDTGIMTDNGITTLTGDSLVGNGSVTINNITLKKGDSDVEKYLGYNLKYYYKDNNGDLTLLFVVPYNVDVVELCDEEIDVDQSQFSTKRIYYDSNKSGYYRIDDYADVIYNGRAYPAYDIDTLKLAQGILTLIDNDNDGEYEVILVEEYYTVYVSGIDVDNEIIYGKYGNSVDYGKYNIVDFSTNDGSPASVDAINEKQVLSVFESYGDSYIKIVISTGGVSGKVEKVRNLVKKTNNMTSGDIENFKKNARETEIIVDGEQLKFSSEYIDAIAEGFQGANVPTMGLAYVFHLDKNGRIAGIEDPTGQQYAYLLKSSYVTGGDMAGMVKTKIFLEDSTILTTVFAKNVTANGVKYKGQVDSSDADSICQCPGLFNEGKGVRQAVKIRLNNKGEITEVETAQDLKESSMSSFGYDKTQFTLCLTGDKTYGGPSQRSFENENSDRYTLASDVVIFNVPPATNFDESKLGVISASSLQEGANYPIQLYDADASWACKFLIIQAGNAGDWFLAPAIVQSIKEQLVDDEPAKVVTALESTNWVTYIESEPGVFPTELAVGDIVKVKKGANDEVTDMKILLSPTRDKDNPVINVYEDGQKDDWSNWYGQLYARSDTGFTLTFDGGKSIKAFTFNDTPVNVYDVESKTARRGSRNDMVMNCPIRDNGSLVNAADATWVYVFKRKGYARCVIVVKY